MFEIDTDLVRLAPYHVAVTAWRTLAPRQQQLKPVGQSFGVIDIEPRAGVGNIRQYAPVQLFVQ